MRRLVGRARRTLTVETHPWKTLEGIKSDKLKIPLS